MKYVEVAGGLGNQMFQYAYYLLIKERFKDACLFMSSSEWEHSGGFELTRVFGIKHTPSFWERIYGKGRVYRKLFSLTHKRYQGQNFKEQPSDLNPDSKFNYFYGTWQSERYFTNPERIRESFQFNTLLLNNQSKTIAKSLRGRELRFLFISDVEIIFPGNFQRDLATAVPLPIIKTLSTT